MGDPKTRGFFWGLGAATAAYMLWPSLQEVARPAAKKIVRGSMAAGDRFRYAIARAREGLEDVIAEAQFDRLRDTTDPEAQAVVDAGAGGAAAPAEAERKGRH